MGTDIQGWFDPSLSFSKFFLLINISSLRLSPFAERACIRRVRAELSCSVVWR